MIYSVLDVKTFLKIKSSKKVCSPERQYISECLKTVILGKINLSSSNLESKICRSEPIKIQLYLIHEESPEEIYFSQICF